MSGARDCGSPLTRQISRIYVSVVDNQNVSGWGTRQKKSEAKPPGG
ncbi:MAG: hypothetical protein H7832_12495 [Magnetococcus sp. DMHC-6]